MECRTTLINKLEAALEYSYTELLRRARLITTLYREKIALYWVPLYLMATTSLMILAGILLLLKFLVKCILVYVGKFTKSLLRYLARWILSRAIPITTVALSYLRLGGSRIPGYTHSRMDSPGKANPYATAGTGQGSEMSDKVKRRYHWEAECSILSNQGDLRIGVPISGSCVTTCVENVESQVLGQLDTATCSVEVLHVTEYTDKGGRITKEFSYSTSADKMKAKQGGKAPSMLLPPTPEVATNGEGTRASVPKGLTGAALGKPASSGPDVFWLLSDCDALVYAKAIKDDEPRDYKPRIKQKANFKET